MFDTLIKKINWTDGRQGTGYKKHRIFESKLLQADCYLLYYPFGSSVPPHKDVVDGKKHYRLNVVLKRAIKGGNFWGVANSMIFAHFPFFLFRPDLVTHGVTKIEEGYRIVFSLGWAVNDKK